MNHFGASTLDELAVKVATEERRICADSERVQTGHAFDHDTIRAGLNTISLPNVLSNLANMAVLEAYNAVGCIADSICGIGTLNDMRPQWRARARELNLTISPEELAAARKFKDVMTDLDAVMGRLGQTLGGAVMPVLERNAALMTKIGAHLIPLIRQHSTALATVFRIASVLGGAGAGLTAFGVAVQVGGTALGGLASVLSMIVSPLVLASGLTGALALALYKTGDAGRALG